MCGSNDTPNSGGNADVFRPERSFYGGLGLFYILKIF
jgi:hypothetical protein